VPVHVYKPEGCETVEDFERKYGTELWKKDEDLYDYAVKVRDHRLSSAFHDS
jgi:phosphoadenosine phosphosulfate reductase